MQNEKKEMSLTKWVCVGLFSLLFFIALGMYGIPQYSVWQQGLSGKAELSRAEWNRQVKVLEAKALKESALLLAEAEIERAKGVAKANLIIGDSLKGNESYLRYLWIIGLHEGNNAVVYIPTEAGLPILEATRLMSADR